jgi:hypothetical protein
VIVRNDLTPPQQAVQAVHAALSVARQFSVPLHEHVVLCAVPNERQLLRWQSKIASSGIAVCAFREPDLGNEFTALATEPVYGEDRRLFRQLQLVKGGL